MFAVRVKTCGISSPDDARACFDLGADYLGLIFAASPRQVSLAQALAIRQAVPEAQLVGVFVDANQDAIEQTAMTVGLNLIQLHGIATADLGAGIKKRTGLPVIDVVHFDPEDDESSYNTRSNEEGADARGQSDYLLFDLVKGIVDPGDGIKQLWRAAGKAAEKRSVFLAGNLSVLNIREALKYTSPFAVDVCRGVEARPGKKDLRAVKQFIAEVKGWQR